MCLTLGPRPPVGTSRVRPPQGSACHAPRPCGCQNLGRVERRPYVTGTVSRSWRPRARSLEVIAFVYLAVRRVLEPVALLSVWREKSIFGSQARFRRAERSRARLDRLSAQAERAGNRLRPHDPRFPWRGFGAKRPCWLRAAGVPVGPRGCACGATHSPDARRRSHLLSARRHE